MSKKVVGRLLEEAVWKGYLVKLKSEEFKFRRSTRKFMESMPEGTLYGFA